MAHFALVNDNNIVETVIVVPDEYEENGQEYLNSLGLNGTWIQTSYNNNIRKNYAGTGYTYDETRDAFIPQKFYPSWILNEETCQWEAPTPMPNDSNIYDWNEDNQSWEEVTNDN